MLNRILIILALISNFATHTFAMQPEVRVFKAGPLHLINNSEFTLNVEIHHVRQYEGPFDKPISLAQGQSITISSIRTIQNIEAGRRMASQGVEGVYEIIVHLPKELGQKEPLNFPLDTAVLDKIAECTRNQNTQEITAFIDLEKKTGMLGFYSYYDLSIKFICGKYEAKPAKELEEEWQFLGTSQSQQPLIEDIIKLHPGWNNQKAIEFYQNLVEQSESQGPYTPLYKEALAGKTNSIKQKFDELVQIAKSENFLSPRARTTIDKTMDDYSEVSLDKDGYVYFKSKKFFSGIVTSKTLNNYINAMSWHKKEIAEELVKGYKIHLMPQNWHELMQTVQRFIRILVSDNELQTIISGFKVRVAPMIIGPKNNKLIMPLMVVYVYQGKDAAQIALNKIHNAFQGIQGLGLPPRYNASVTDLIYVAQGDGEFKGENFSKYYEQPKQIYYERKFTGTEQNYHLKHPATQADLK